MNLVTETNNFCSGAILLSCLVQKQEQHSRRDLNLEHIFVFMAFIAVISSPKNVYLCTVLLMRLFPGLQKLSSPGLETQDTFRLSAFFILKSRLLIKRMWSRHSNSNELSFLTGGTSSAGLKLSFPEFWTSQSLFLASKNKLVTFGANRFIRSQSTSEHTYTRNIIYICEIQTSFMLRNVNVRLFNETRTVFFISFF